MARIAEPYELAPQPTDAVEASQVLSTSFDLEVTSGTNVGLRVSIHEGLPPMVAGASAACGLRLMDPAVCRRHFRFEVVGGRLVVRDGS
jgi:hypothetical protein